MKLAVQEKDFGLWRTTGFFTDWGQERLVRMVNSSACPDEMRVIAISDEGDEFLVLHTGTGGHRPFIA